MPIGDPGVLLDIVGLCLIALGFQYVLWPALSSLRWTRGISVIATRRLGAGLVGAAIATALSFLVIVPIAMAGTLNGTFSSQSAASLVATAMVSPVLLGLVIGVITRDTASPPDGITDRKNVILLIIGLLVLLPFPAFTVLLVLHHEPTTLPVWPWAVITLLYSFAAGGLADVSSAGRATRLRIAVGVVVAYALLVAAVKLLSVMGPVMKTAAVLIEFAVFLVSFASMAAAAGFAYCSAPFDRTEQPSQTHFLRSIAAGLAFGILLPLIALPGPATPLGLVTLAGVPAGVVIGVADGQARLLLRHPRPRWRFRAVSRRSLGWDFVQHRFANGLLVGTFVTVLLGFLFWYAGAVAGTFLIPGERPDPLGALASGVFALPASLPFGAAIGIMSVLAVWANHRLTNVDARAYLGTGYALLVLGILVALHKQTVALVFAAARLINLTAPPLLGNVATLLEILLLLLWLLVQVRRLLTGHDAAARTGPLVDGTRREAGEPRPSIFLSHSSQDKPFVRALAQRLRQSDVRVWLDEAEIKVGDSLTDKVGKAVDEARFFGVVLSRHSIASEWVQRELQTALQRELTARQVVILPILLERVQLPPFLRDKRYADFTDPARFEESFEHLLGGLGALVAT
jgi:hypothetical protein